MLNVLIQISNKSQTVNKTIDNSQMGFESHDRCESNLYQIGLTYRKNPEIEVGPKWGIGVGGAIALAIDPFLGPCY